MKAVKFHWRRVILVGVLSVACVMVVASLVRAQELNGHGALAGQVDRMSPLVAEGPLSDTLVYSLYLPIVVRPRGMLYGRVTQYGVPVTNTNITLAQCLTWFVNPGGMLICETWTSYGATTDQDGRYAFIDMPTLVTGDNPLYNQTYSAYWANDGTVPGRLSGWNSRTIVSYTLGDDVELGTFDIGDMTAVTPTSGAVLHFPATFQWQPRRNLPTDNYTVCLTGGMSIPPVLMPDLVCYGGLGYSNQLVIDAPFDGIDYGYSYTWFVTVPDETGGVGTSLGGWIIFAAP